MKNLKKFLTLILLFLSLAGQASAASILKVQQGGTGVNTLTGIIQGNGTSPFSAITVNSPLTFSASTLGCQASSTSQAGCLSSTDWNTFNGKLSTTLTTNHLFAGVAGVATDAGNNLTFTGSTLALASAVETITHSNNTSGEGLIVSNTNTGSAAFAAMVVGNGSSRSGGTFFYSSSFGTTQLRSSLAFASYTDPLFIIAGTVVGTPNIAIQSGLTSPNGIYLIGSTGNIGIGTASPTQKLHVAGSIRMVDGNQASGKVLTSDANGVGSWQTPSTGVAWGAITGTLSAQTDLQNALNTKLDTGLSQTHFVIGDASNFASDGGTDFIFDSSIDAFSVGSGISNSGNSSIVMGNGVSNPADYSFVVGWSANYLVVDSTNGEGQLYDPNNIYGMTYSLPNQATILYTPNTTLTLDEASTALRFSVSGNDYFRADVINDIYQLGYFSTTFSSVSGFFAAPINGTYIMGDGGSNFNGTNFVINDSAQTYTFSQMTGNGATLATLDNNGILGQTVQGAIVAENEAISQTGAITALTTVSPSANTTYQVGGYIRVTAISAGTVVFQVTWTDETSTSQTYTFATSTGTGLTNINAITIRVKTGTTATLKTTFAGISVAYDIGGWIQQISV